MERPGKGLFSSDQTSLSVRFFSLMEKVQRVAEIQLTVSLVRSVLSVGGEVALLTAVSRDGRIVPAIPVITLLGRVLQAVPTAIIDQVEIEVQAVGKEVLALQGKLRNDGRGAVERLADVHVYALNLLPGAGEKQLVFQLFAAVSLMHATAYEMKRLAHQDHRRQNSMRRDLRKGWREGLKGGSEAANARNGVGRVLFHFVSRLSPHEKRPVAVTRQAIFPRFRSVSPEEIPRNSRFRRVSRKKLGVFLDLGALLRRNAAEFRI